MSWLSLLPLIGPRLAQGRPLKSDECVLAIPSLVRVEGAGPLQADIEVWVYEHEQRAGMRSLFARYLQIDLSTLTRDEQARFDERTRLFLKDSERAKAVRIRFDALPQSHAGNGEIVLNRTNAAGRSSTTLALPRSLLHTLEEPIRYRLPADCQGSGTQGILWPIAPEGLSIVSDIDDTIKISEVRDTRRLLRNTFLEPFKAVPGMAAWYRHIEARFGRGEAETPGADPAARVVSGQSVAPTTPLTTGSRTANLRFHYLSSSPLQLLPLLESFLQAEGFPAGQMLLRESTAWQRLLPGEGDSEAHKLGQLRTLMRAFPLRRFVLIGDSGERDPEIYARIAEQYPAQVAAILIRDVTDETADAPRYRQVFRDIARRKWAIFRQGDEARAAFDTLQQSDADTVPEAKRPKSGHQPLPTTVADHP